MTTEFVTYHIREAQLIVSSPERVASELKQYAGKFLYEGKLQENLLARNNPLIDLALAQYTTEKEILTALYKKSCVQPKDSPNEKYLLGLKIACLSNECSHHGWDIPKGIEEVFGIGEFERLVTKGSEEEIAALFSNPSFFSILEALYKNEGIFSSLADDQRRLLVAYSKENPKLALCQDSENYPDMNYYSVHKAILSMLASAPITHDWADTLFKLLLALDPEKIFSLDEPITSIISRWSDLPPPKNEYSGNGTYTNLLLKDELCCLIAAMYGRSFSDKKSSRWL